MRSSRSRTAETVACSSRSTSRWSGRRQLQPQHPDERRSLQVAQDLERVGGDRPGAVGSVNALRADDAAADGRVGVALRLDARAAVEAGDELGPEAHRLEQVELEPAGDHLAAHLGGRRVEARQRLRQEPECLVRVRRALAESVRQLDDVPGGGGRVQVVAEPEVRVLERRGGDDVERATHREDELHVAERLERAPDPRPRATHALGDDPQLSEARGEHGQDPIGLAEVHRAQDDAFRLVDARPRAHRPTLRNLLHRRIMIRMRPNQLPVPAP